ncbi:saccharopine dehydrogenase NADP-binding domain-containing protein [Dehalococcoidia bacterium]|nr:saccharopine dehydrogenase NADP-binding domain-containing protein [Dehalococcoidia bacterium]
MPTEDRVVLLGCGTVGSQAFRWLAQKGPFSSILLVDRNGQQATRLAESIGQGEVKVAGVVEADIADRDRLVRLMRGARMVISTVGPFFRYGRMTLEAALETGVDYVDVNDDADSLQGLLAEVSLRAAAQKSGKALVIGAGTSPGATGHLAGLGVALLDRVEAIHIFLTSTISWRGYPVFAHFTHTLGQPSRFYRNGQWVKVPPFAEEEVVHFLEVDEATRCYAAGHPEPLIFPQYFPGVQEVTMKLGRVPNSLMDMFRHLYLYGLMDTTPIELEGGTRVVPADFTAAFLASDTADRIFGFSRARSLSARLVRVVGQRDGQRATISCYHTAGAISGQDAAIIASLLVTGHLQAKGLTTVEGMDPWPIMEELLQEGGSFRVVHEEVRQSFTSLKALRAQQRDR